MNKVRGTLGVSVLHLHFHFNYYFLLAKRAAAEDIACKIVDGRDLGIDMLTPAQQLAIDECMYNSSRLEGAFMSCIPELGMSIRGPPLPLQAATSSKIRLYEV